MHVVRDRSYQVSALGAHRSSLVPSPRIVGKFVKSGGADRDRTYDLFRARESLSQLSYGPTILTKLLFLIYTLFFLDRFLCLFVFTEDFIPVISTLF